MALLLFDAAVVLDGGLQPASAAIRAMPETAEKTEKARRGQLHVRKVAL